jgi:hypothetical protein
VTAAELLPDFIEAFEAEWKSETARRAARAPTADLDAEIARQAARVDRLAAAVADAPDIAPLLAQLRRENATLTQLRARRANLPAAPKTAPTMPSAVQIRAYFDDLVSTLEAEPAGARDILAASFSTIRLVPTATAYRLELTRAEVCASPNCGGAHQVRKAENQMRLHPNSPSSVLRLSARAVPGHCGPCRLGPPARMKFWIRAEQERLDFSGEDRRSRAALRGYRARVVPRSHGSAGSQLAAGPR